MTISDKGRVLIFSGPSGIGKSTRFQKLRELHDDIVLPPGFKTRPARSGEIDGVDKHFITEEDLWQSAERGEVLEYTRTIDHYSGTLLKSIESALKEGKTVILDMDPKGAMVAKRLIAERGTDCTTFFVAPESMELQQERLAGRDAVVVEGRLEDAFQQLPYAVNYDHVLVIGENDTPEAFAADIKNILSGQTANSRVVKPDQLVLKLMQQKSTLLKSPPPKKPHIYAIGCSMVDKLYPEGAANYDAIAHQFEMPIGGGVQLDSDKIANLEKHLPTDSVVVEAGGSLANTLHTLAGISQTDITFLASTGDDENGQIFRKAICKIPNLTIVPNKGVQETDTSTCLVLPTSERDRASAVHLGSCDDHLSLRDVDANQLGQANIVLLEGYLLNQKNGPAIWNHVQSLVRPYQTFAVTLSADHCARRHQKQMQETVHHYADVTFANEKELMALYGTDNLETALETMQQAFSKRPMPLGSKYPLAFITNSEKGGYIVSKEGYEAFSPVAAESVVNSAGAGDAFAGGVLAGLISNMKPAQAAKIGAHLGSAAVQQAQPRLSNPIENLPTVFAEALGHGDQSRKISRKPF